ncbi:MAG TPA: NAD(P)H-dependent oxidoreductase [Kiloniellales bacterium]|nr:NAD(P)H-dependent oxidoreductase [Kiloniellales bacterium]
MQAHIVLAHPEPRSFNGHLARVAQQTLEARGWKVSFSDLHAMGFDPNERPEHYGATGRFDVQAEQRKASNNAALPVDVKKEISNLDAADLVILQYPLWWHLPPAILKGWFDRVFVYGEVYRSDFRFEKGRWVGRKAMLSLTCGTSPETYAYNGRSADMDLLLWPVHFTLAYVGFGVLAPHVAYGVEAGLRYSDPAVVDARLREIERRWVDRLQAIEAEPTLPFNKMSEWGPDGRIKPEAPVYTPFIRHRRELKID